MFTQARIPRTEPSLQRAFTSCQHRGKFKSLPKDGYSDYLQRAQKDLASAERDLQAGDFYWCRVKAYQSLFHLLNALLVKHVGYFSKDHSYIIVALMNSTIITEEVAGKLHLLMPKVITTATAKGVFDDIDEYRIERNFALYKPKAWEQVKREDVAQELEKIKLNFQIMVGLL